MGGVFSKKNLPLSLIDEITLLCADVYTDSKIAKTVKCKRTKTTHLIKKVLAPEFQNEIVQKVGKSSFSLILDETTDISAV